MSRPRVDHYRGTKPSPNRVRAIKRILGGGIWKCRTCGTPHPALSGLKLYEIRKKAGLTGKELATKVGFSQGWLSGVERGQEKLSVERAEVLLEALGVKLPES